MTKGIPVTSALRSTAIAVGSVAAVAVAAVGIGAVATPGGSTAESPRNDRTTSLLIPVRELHRGDLVVTEHGDVVRVAGKRRLENGRFRVRRTSPWRDDDRIYLIGTRRGYGPRQVFVVLERDVPVEAVQHLESPVPTFAPTSEPTATP